MFFIEPNDALGEFLPDTPALNRGRISAHLQRQYKL